MTGFIAAAIIVGLLSVAVCAGAGSMNYGPNDITIVSVAVVEVFLLIYATVRAVGSFTGEGPQGPGWEFWSYLLTSMVIPVSVVYWALMERSRWGNFVMAIAGAATIVMVFRMEQLWYGSLVG